MNKKVAQEICKQINEWVDLSWEVEDAKEVVAYTNKARGLQKALDIAGVQYETDNWGKCFID